MNNGIEEFDDLDTSLGEEAGEQADEAMLEASEEEAIEEGITVFGEAPVIQVIEAALMAAGKPMTLEQLAALFDEDYRPDKPAMKQAMADLSEMCEGRGFELKEIASGWRFQVRQELAPWVGRMWDEKPQRYTRALLETLALVAYRQPITRGEIEDIRGVSVSTNIIRSLQEREWVRVVGHRDVPGRPAMYATTRQFLDYFNLRNLDELPPLSELRDLDAMASQLEAAGIPAADLFTTEDGEIVTKAEAAEAAQAAEAAEADELDAADLVSVEKAQAFQEEGNQNIDKLFAELDEMEGSLTLTYKDYDPLTDPKPEDEIATRAATKEKREETVAALEPAESEELESAQLEDIELEDVEPDDSQIDANALDDDDDDDDDDFEIYHSSVVIEDEYGKEDEEDGGISSLMDELDDKRNDNDD